jgi:Putative peptidoglycan binding domain
MHSVDKLPRHVAGRPGRNRIILDQINRRPPQFGPVAGGARIAVRLWIVGAIVVFLLSFAATRWLPDLVSSARDGVSEAAPSTSTSTPAVPASSREADDGTTVTPNPIIPILIRRSTPPHAQESDLRPHAEISPPLVAIPESVDIISTPQRLDIREVEDAKRVQQRLIDLGFLFGPADGIWGSRSRQALQDFRVANGLGDSDTWDEATQERLLTGSDANAANGSDVSFIGGWGVDAAQCRESPLTITARRAHAFGATCEFHSTQRESTTVWRLRAACANDTERWNANIRFTLSGSKLTWSSERGTTTYVRCRT